MYACTLHSSIQLTDNAACVSLVDGRPDGLVWLLEDECHLPKPGDASLVSRLYAAHGSHAHLLPASRHARKPGAGAGGRSTPRKGGVVDTSERFAVAHFAGTVQYDAAGFVSKNSDVRAHALHPSPLATHRGDV